jgi:hypothetical protein
METKTVNLRDLPEDFVRRAKAYAALSGLSLKDFFMQSVESAMQNEIQAKSAGALFTKNDKRKKPK